MNEPKITIHDLNFLVGEWKGTGYAEYPTIEATEYTEILVFSRNDKDAVIHYEQRDWIKSNGERNNEFLSWESGFIIDKGDGTFEMLCAHFSGRSELLKGSVQKTEDKKVKFQVENHTILNDDRLVRSGRIFIFSEDSIEYEVRMSTGKNLFYQRHLSAKLRKVDSNKP
jgi:hypothetical protein